MRIQPVTANLTIGETQEFRADTAVSWCLSPSSGRIQRLDSASIIYRAPRVIWISRNVQLQATANGESASADITLSSAPCWIAALTVFWPAAAMGLIALLFWIWPAPTPAASLEIDPPLVTMAAGSSRQFAARLWNDGDPGVVWSASDGVITPSGLYTAPRASTGRVVITATRKSDPAETSSALVLLGNSLAIAPALAELAPSNSTNLAAIDSSGQPVDVEWFAAPAGLVDVKDGRVTASRQIARSERAIVTVKDRRDPLRQAGSIVIVSRSGGGDAVARERSLGALVLIMGALGAFLGASRSFANFVGNRTFRASWALFYFFRPVFGAGLALLVFFGCRAGFVAALQSTVADNSGAGFVSGVTGLFADTVLGKLKEVITALFPTEEPRSDKMHSTSGPP